MSGNGPPGTARCPGTLSPGERVLHHIAMVAVGLSGVVLAWVKYGMEASDDPFTVVNHPMEPHLLDLHVLAGPLWILAVGMLLREHVLRRLRSPRHRLGRRSGAWSAALLLPMVASGYLLQVVTAEAWRGTLVWVHLLSGGAYLMAFLAHLVAARVEAWRLRAGTVPGVGSDLDPEGLHLRVGTAGEGG